MNDNGQRETAATLDPFAAFSLIWACTALVHQLAFTFWTESWQGWLLVVAAIACIVRSNCVLRFTVLVVASLLNLWHKLPFVPNHILFEGMLHLVMAIGLAGFFLRREGREAFAASGEIWKSRLALVLVAVALKAAYFYLPGLPRGYLLGGATTLFLLVAAGRMLFHEASVGNGAVFFHNIAPVLRLGLFFTYLWAAIQKLNHDYLDPEFSCAAKLHTEIAEYFGPLIPTDPWALHAAIWGSFLFELGIPVLLYIRRTRFIGFIAAVWFHLWLAIHPAAGIFSFSSLILAMLYLFLPVSWDERLRELWDAQLRWIGGGSIALGRRIAVRFAVAGFFFTLITQMLLYLLVGRNYEVFHIANRVGCSAFFVWGGWIGACYLVAGWRGKKFTSRLPNRFRWNWACVGLILVVTNGIYPWIGGRTQTSFSMYSNLRSEGPGNHVFLKRIDLLPYQEDMVEVVDSEPDILAPANPPRGIQQFANLGHTVMPYFEFRRLVSEMDGDLEVTYRRNGELLKLSREEGEIVGDEKAFEPLPLPKRKFLWFRRLANLDGPMECTH
ncbi:MAG: HTTM domain-containing protein [Verrucomicrobiales bacterium]